MDQALLDGGYRCYTGENIDVYFNTWKVVPIASLQILAIAYVATASYLISNESRGSCRMKSTSPLW